MATTTTTTLPATTTTVDEYEAARLAYFYAVAPNNELQSTVWAPFPDGAPWAELPAICSATAPGFEQLAKDLQAYPSWPDEAADEIDELVAVNAALAGVLYECAQAPGTRSSQADIWERYDAIDPAGAAASAARLALGLPIER